MSLDGIKVGSSPTTTTYGYNNSDLTALGITRENSLSMLASTSLNDPNRAQLEQSAINANTAVVQASESGASNGSDIPTMVVYSNQGQSTEQVLARLRQQQGVGQTPDTPTDVSTPVNSTSSDEDFPVPPIPPDQIPPVATTGGTSLSSNPVLAGSSSAQVNVSDQRIRLTPKDMSILGGGDMSSLSNVSNSLSLNPTGYLANLLPTNPTVQSAINCTLSTTNSSSIGQSLLYPLIATNGFMFPYTPQIQYTGQANYGTQALTHSNQDFRYYQNTSATTFNISGPFSAQTQSEAAYLLACIHFLRVVTKMRFGQSSSVGTPPPVLVLNGYGNAMFYNLPVIITNFMVDMPNNVDYIRTDSAGLSGWVPIYTTITVTCVVQNTPNKLRTFNWDAFAKGTLMQQGGWS